MNIATVLNSKLGHNSWVIKDGQLQWYSDNIDKHYPVVSVTPEVEQLLEKLDETTYLDVKCALTDNGLLVDPKFSKALQAHINGLL